MQLPVVFTVKREVLTGHGDATLKVAQSAGQHITDYGDIEVA